MDKSLHNDDGGVALVAVVMAMLVLSLLSAATISMTTSNLKNSLEERTYQASYYIAEAGANYYREYVGNEILDIYNHTDSAAQFYSTIQANLIDKENPTSLNVSSGHFEPQYGEEPEAQLVLIDITESASDLTERTYQIQSLGRLGDISRQVIKSFSLKWISKSSMNWENAYAIFTYDDMDLKGGTINGPIATYGKTRLQEVRVNGSIFSREKIEINGGTIKGPLVSLSEERNAIEVVGGNPKIGDYYVKAEKNLGVSHTDLNWWLNDKSHYGKKLEAEEVGDLGVAIPSQPKFEDVIFPEFPDRGYDKKEDIILDNWEASKETLSLSQSVTYVPNITITSNYELTIKYRDKDILMVDNLKVPQGKINLEGNGTLKIYIKDKMILEGSTAINPVNDGASTSEKKEAAKKLELYIQGDGNPNTNKELKLGSNIRLYGSIIAEDANIDIGNGSGVIGNIITWGKKVNISGGSSVITQIVYAPNAHTRLLNGAKVEGQIVSNTYYMDGGTSVSYDPNTGSGPIEPPFPSETVDDIDDLISSEKPITEK